MTRTLALALMIAFAPSALAQKTFRCVDAKGITHYTTEVSVCKTKPVEVKGPAPRAGAGPAPGPAASAPAVKSGRSTPPEFRAHDQLDEESAKRRRVADPNYPR